MERSSTKSSISSPAIHELPRNVLESLDNDFSDLKPVLMLLEHVIRGDPEGNFIEVGKNYSRASFFTDTREANEQAIS